MPANASIKINPLTNCEASRKRVEVLIFVHVSVLVLAKTQTRLQIIGMQLGRSANVVVRTVLAVLFGFMSLFHGTVMALAKASPVADHQAMAAAHHVVKTDGHAAGHHHPGSEQQSNPAIPDAAPSCYGVGCFIVLNSFAPVPPSASVRPIATLSPSIVEAMVPTHLDPVVPPPRIQV